MHAAVPHQHVVKAFVPELATKDLAVVRTGGKTKVRLSTNILPLMGFEAGTRHSVERLPGDSGLRLAFDAGGRKKVYQRSYKSRRNNPFETVVELSSQADLGATIPSYTERVHITMRHGEILIRPLANRTFSIRQSMSTSPFTTMVAMTSGVDAHCLQRTGFDIQAVLEYRPPEARDTRDLTETGVLTALANCSPRVVFNEDISTIDWSRVSSILDGGPKIAVVHLSLQCDDFTLCKSPAAKKKSLENLSCSSDLVFDALRMIETVNPGCIVLEQVRGFASSEMGQLFRTKLRKWGYHVSEAILKGSDFGGATGRERHYLVASVFPGFEMPVGLGQRLVPLWSEIVPFLDGCRDVTHTKSVHGGVESGRSRLITPETLISPTVLKSQNRQTKDSVYVAMPDGRFLLPSIDLLRHLNGIDPSFDLNSVSGEQAAEQVGQSIEVPMHHAVCKAVYSHIAVNVGRHSIVQIKRATAPAAPRMDKPASSPSQAVLF